MGLITVETEKGTKVSGLAFISVGENQAVTALHLLKGAKKVSVKFQNGEEIVSPGLVDRDEKRGIALLNLPAHGKTSLHLAAVKITPGTTVNCGAVRDGTYGFIQLSIAEVHQGADGVERYILSGEASEGGSGGPALDPKGNVVGLILEETMNGSVHRTLVPSAFILALNGSLPTREWSSLDAPQSTQKPGNSAPGPLDELDTSLLDFFILLSDHQVIYCWADEITRGNGFQQGVPQQMYDYQTKLGLGLNRIKGLTSKDPLREGIMKTALEVGANQFSSAEFLINAVVAGQQASNWVPQAQDLQKRSKASMSMANELLNASLPAIRNLYERSSVFHDGMPKDLVLSMGIEQRPSIFRLGVQTFIRNPFSLVVVYEGSFASTLGLQTGDLIVSAAGNVFGPNGSIEDFKLIIQNNLGKTIETKVNRNNNMIVLKMEIPPEIPADFLY